MSEAMVQGWCPGALRPMMTGDGLLVRLRLSGVLSLPLAREIAALATKFGNGLINLSARGNLQLRGVSEATYPALIEALLALNLLDKNEKSEAVRNVLISPLAGFDPTALLDIRAISKALEERISADELIWQLPGKFSFIVEDGGAYPLSDIAADVRFVAVNEAEFGLQLGESPGFFGLWPASEVPEVAGIVASVFVEARQHTRYRHIQNMISGWGKDPFVADLHCETLPQHVAKPASLSAIFGQQERFVGLGVPFGLLSAAQLELLANLSEKAGAAEIRLTPWRALLVTGLVPENAAALVADLAGRDFIVAADDPRLRLIACTGKPGCWQASVAAQTDALKLAGLTGELVHISGCAKGCAHPKAAAYTFVGRDGFYDLVENGKADGAPSVTHVSPDALTGVLASRIAHVQQEDSLVL